MTRSSGVDAYLVDKTVECDECGSEQDVELAVDPSDRDDPEWTCAECGHLNTFFWPEPDDDYLLAYWRQ